MPVLLKSMFPRTRPERISDFEAAFDVFIKTFGVKSSAAKALRDRLMAVPPELRHREERMLCGLSPLASEMPVPQFKNDLIAALKESGIWQRMSPTERNSLSHRLLRKNSTIADGRPYPYSQLEKNYAEAISEALRPTRCAGKLDTIPTPTFASQLLAANSYSGITSGQERYRKRAIPRSYSKSKGAFGPAFDLLLAALNLALPNSGSGSKESVDRRLKDLGM